MAFVPFNNVCRVEMRFAQDNQLCANVFHVQYGGTVSATLLEEIADIFIAWYGTTSTQVSNTVTLREVDVRDLSTPSAIGILRSTGLPITGALIVEALPNSVSLAIKWSTGLTGRSFRGRSYHIGLVENQVTRNAVAQAVAADLVLRYGELISDLKVAGHLLVVASRRANNADRPLGVATEILNCSVADLIVDSARKRLPGRGR